LGCHVGDLPLEYPRPRVVGRIERLRDAEVEHLHLSVVRNEDVVRGHVAVNEVQRRAIEARYAVRVLETFEQLHDDGEVIVQGERGTAAPYAMEDPVERLPIEELHRDEVSIP